MSMNGEKPRRPLRIAVLLFIVGCFAAVWSGLRMEQDQQQLKWLRFNELAKRMESQLQARIDRYQLGLRGARGAVVAAGIDSLSRQRFRAYMTTRDLKDEFPGARGFGFVRRVLPEREAAFLAAVRQDGRANFQIKQLAPHAGERLVIVYTEPEGRNMQAVGLDIASEPHRLEAAEGAMRSGNATLTRPLTLVQASGNEGRGLLFLLPVYPDGQMPAAEDERRSSAVGLVYTPLVIDEVMADFDFGGEITMALTDGEDAAVAPFYQSGSIDAAADGLSIRKPLAVYGRTWLVEFKAKPLFVERLNLLDPKLATAAMVGLVLLSSLLLYGVLLNRQRRLQIIQEQAQLAAIVESSNDAIIGKNLDGVVTSWNKAAERIFGFTREQAVGQPLLSLVIPEERQFEEQQILAQIKQGQAVSHFTTLRRTRDGGLLDVSITVFPIVDAGGRVVSAAKIVSDVSQQKAAERRIRELNETLEAQVAQRTAELALARQDLQTVLNTVPSLIGYWDKNLINRFANLAYQEWFGVEHERIAGMHLRQLLGNSLFEYSRPHIEAVLRGEAQRFERSVPNPDGSGQRHSFTQYLPDEVAGEVRGFYVIAHDVTEIVEKGRLLGKTLRENELLTRTITEQLLFSVTNRAGTILEVNDNFCQLSGYSREELLGQNHRIINSGHHSDDFWREMWRTITSGKAWRNEVCNRAKDGSLYWLDNIIAPVHSEEGRIERFISIRVDITQRKQAEAEVSRIHSLLTTVLRAATEISIIATDTEGMIQLFNSGAENLLGYRAEQMIGKFTPAVIHCADEVAARGQELSLEYGRPIEGFKVFVHKAELEGAEAREWTYIRQNGARIQVSLVVTAMRDERGEISGYLGVAQNISELKKQQATIRRMLETSPVAVRVSAEEGRKALFVNQRFADLVQYDREQAAAIDLRDYYVDRQAFDDIRNQLADGQVVVDKMVQLHVPEQPEHCFAWVLSSFMPIDYEGQSAVLAWLYDVTELHNAQVLAESANRAKSDFLANMSHEIRTPMNAVLALAQLLEQEALAPDQYDMVKRIRTAGRSLLVIINDILDFSKIEAGQLRIDPHAFKLSVRLEHIDSLLGRLAKDKGLEWHIERMGDVPDNLFGDSLRLEQILTNFANNAIKFTERGAVVLSVRQVARTDDGAELRFEVKDSGIGMDADTLERLFKPFSQADSSTTRRFGGTGLGLSICKSLVDLMGGRIGVESQVGVGSLFWFELPLQFGAEAESLPHSKLSPMARGRRLAGCRILAVDDNEMNLDVVSRALQKEQAQVARAGDGLQALERLRAEPEGFDAVLMDMQMPVMDGLTATRAVRKELGLADLPIIAFSAGVLAEERQAMFDAGVVDFVSKPVDVEELVGCLMRWSVPAAVAADDVAPLAPHRQMGFPDIPGIDRQRAENLLDGDLKFFEQLLQGFCTQAPAMLQPVEQELQAGGGADSAAVLHKMCSMAGNVGALRLADACRALEHAILKGGADKADLLAQFRQCFDELLAAAGSWLAQNAALQLAQPVAGDAGPDIDQLRNLAAELSPLLSRNDFEAKHVSQEIERMLAGTPLADAYQPVAGAISVLQFDAAAKALHAFRDRLKHDETRSGDGDAPDNTDS